MTFVARLGSFDFSGYLRVGPGEGLDPYDGDGFLEPAFNEGPFGDGQPLLNVDRRNRMMAWPLYLKDSETALTNLVTDPSAEAETEQWSPSGSVFIQPTGSTYSKVSDSDAPRGNRVHQVVGTGTVDQGAYISLGTLTSGVTYAARIHIKRTSGTDTIKSAIGRTTSPFQEHVIVSAGDPGSAYTEYTLLFTPAFTDTYHFYVRKNGTAAITFRYDMAMCVASDAMVPYGDGDTAGWKWNGAPHLSTSSTLVGKDGLHELVQILNREIQNPANKPLRLEWRDDDATNPTYYDVAYARFDPDYHFRRSQHGWAAGILRVWCSPAYGHTATYRVAASAAGTGVLVKAAIASSPIGDAPALVDGQVQIGSYVDKDGHLTGLSILPHPSYVCDIPAPSLLNGAGASLIGASGAAGSQVLGVLFQGTSLSSQALPAFDVALSPASHYEGRNRVLMVARANHLTGIGLRAFDGVDAIGPTAIATQYHEGYAVTDLGVWDVRPRNTQSTVVLSVYGGGMPATYNLGVPTNATGAHGLIVNRVIVLPEDTTSFVLDSEREPVAFDSFSQGSRSLNGAYDELGNAYAERSGLGFPMVSPTHHAIIVASGNADSNAFLDTFIRDARYLADVRMRTPIAGATNWVEVGKSLIVNSEDSQRGAAWFVGPSSYLAVFNEGGDLASGAVPMAALDKDVRLDFTVRSKRLTAALWSAGSLVASVSASHAAADIQGKPLVRLVATHSAASPYVLMRSLAIHSVASTARPARSVYHSTASGAEVQDNASVFLRDVAGEQIAQTPQAVPSSAAIAAFSMPLHGGPANDVMGVEVRVNERFAYAR